MLFVIWVLVIKIWLYYWYEKVLNERKILRIFEYFVFSLDGIIERYKKEEIVEGHTLGAPVTRVGSF